ncbi:MAG: hypothetical protein AAGH82_10795, partial [Pseudomonadota bacterium]
MRFWSCQLKVNQASCDNKAGRHGAHLGTSIFANHLRCATSKSAQRSHHMNVRLKKFIGTILMIILVVLYSLVAVALA